MLHHSPFSLFFFSTLALRKIVFVCNLHQLFWRRLYSVKLKQELLEGLCSRRVSLRTAILPQQDNECAAAPDVY